MTQPLEGAPIVDALLAELHAQDQALYPVSLPFSRLQSWRDASPDTSILCRLNGQDVGALIALPLQTHHWEDLLSGTLKENNVEAGMFVANDAEGEDVALHVFHVERFEGHEGVRGIGKLAVQLLQEIANKKSWNVIGYSALTASDGGRAVFSKLGFESTGYQEVFVESADGELDLVCVGPGETVTDISQVTGEIDSRSVMMVRRGNECFR